MVHLPALHLANKDHHIMASAQALHLAIRGLHGEGSTIKGHLYQLSNQRTLGQDEHTIADQFDQALRQLATYEDLAREHLLQRQRPLLEDRVFRAVGNLQAVRLLAVDETIDYLSDVRLGIVSGLITDVDLSAWNQARWSPNRPIANGTPKPTATPGYRWPNIAPGSAVQEILFG